MPSSLDSFIATIEQCKERAPKELTDTINRIASKTISLAIEEMSKQVGYFLNEKLNDDKHTKEQVKAVIELFPEALSHKGRGGYLPIQRAVYSGARYAGSRSSVTFVPLMARKGCRLDVGGNGSRGGLLSVLPNDGDGGHNTLECLAHSMFQGGKGTAEDDEFDRKRAQVLEELRDLNLLKKADIEEYGLLFLTLNPECQRRFAFLSSFDPAALGARKSQWTRPIYYALSHSDVKVKEKRFEMALKTGMMKFPGRLGFLFCKYQGITACHKAFDNIGVDKAMETIRKCIPPCDNHRILHHAFQYAPDLVSNIAQYYPDAIFLRDDNGHTLSQFKFYISLRRGKNTFKNQSLFFLEATCDQINTVDPKTGLCPFMSAAVGEKSDLSAVYYLLCRNPKLVGLNKMNNVRTADKSKRSRKRERKD